MSMGHFPQKGPIISGSFAENDLQLNGSCIKNTGAIGFLISMGRGGGLGSRPKKMYGERLGDGVEYHLMKPTPRR